MQLTSMRSTDPCSPGLLSLRPRPPQQSLFLESFLLGTQSSDAGLDQEVSGHRVAFLVGDSSIDSYNQMVGTERSLQASIEVQRSGDTATRTFRDKKGNMDVEWLSATSFRMSLQENTIRCHGPATELTNAGSKEVLGLGFSPAGGLMVTSGADGSALVWDPRRKAVERALEGHIHDVNYCAVFPSGQVVLTGGADARLKIWGVENGQCAATLVGHGSAVTSAAMIDRGRNFISASRDGTVRLWDCSSQSCLRTLVTRGQAINDVKLQADSQYVNDNPANEVVDGEVGTDGHLCLIAAEDGSLLTCDVRARQPVHQLALGSAVNSCAYLSSHHAVCGNDDGGSHLIDFRQPKEPVQRMQRSEAPVTAVCRKDAESSVLASNDGSTCVYNWITKCVEAELTGTEEKINRVVMSTGRVHTAGYDGVVRQYALD